MTGRQRVTARVGRTTGTESRAHAAGRTPDVVRAGFMVSGAWSAFPALVAGGLAGPDQGEVSLPA